MAYTGPLQVILVHGAVPTDTPAADVSFDNGAGNIIAAFTSGPYAYNAEIRLALFRGSYAPIPPDPSPCPDPIPDIPSAADPPFPPVWPYLFSSDQIYGRDAVGIQQVMVRQDTYQFDAVATYQNSGNALDLTGATLTMTARFEIDSPTAVFTLDSAGNGIVVTDAPGGAFTVTIPSTATVTVPRVRTVLYFDIQYLLGSTRYTIQRGTFIILPDVTLT